MKPANLGSSIGISKALTRAALIDAIDKAARYDLKILVEESVEQARELECAVIGNDSARASVIGEIVPGAEFYDYTTKYLDDRSQLIVPADLPKDKVGKFRTCRWQPFMRSMAPDFPGSIF